jgi:hypothetical protein
MLLLLAAVAPWPPPEWHWWRDFQQEYKRCGVVFNVDGPGPVGDGITFDDNFEGLILSTKRKRGQKSLACVARWARKQGIAVRYRGF